MPLGLDDHFYKYVVPVVVIEACFWAYAFTTPDVRTSQVIFGLVGLWWCLIALWVEVKIEHTYPGFDYKKPTDPEMKAYRPFCDFAPWANCSIVLMSPSGRFLRHFGIAKQGGGEGWLNTVRGWIDVPNPTLGVLFFTFHLFYNVLVDIVYFLKPWVGQTLFNFADLVLPWAFFVACCGVGLMSCWLAYQLFIVLGDFCVVCVSMYVVNFALIPMMHNVCNTDSNLMRGFGAVPDAILYPFLVIDGLMLVGVLGLWLCGGPAHARELTSSTYEQLPASA